MRARMPTLDASFVPDRNAFDVLRVSFAAMVLLSHATLLSGHADPISTWSGQQENLGGIAVDGFFAVSGFLVARSYALSRGTGGFLLNRALRIGPAYVVAVLVVALGFGPLWAWLERGQIQTAFLYGPTGALAWIRDTLLFRTDQDAGFGGLLRGNPVAGWVDAPLWTLRYECACYAALAVLGWLDLLSAQKPFAIAVAATLALALHALNSASTGLGTLLVGGLVNEDFIRLGAFFFAGSFAWFFRDRVLLNWKVAAASAGLLLLSLRQGGFQFFAVPALTYFIIWLGCRLPFRRLRADYSYGLYLYGFPVQQTLALCGVHESGVPLLVVVSVGATWVLAATSAAFIETPSLLLKRRAAGSRPPRLDNIAAA